MKLRTLPYAKLDTSASYSLQRVAAAAGIRTPDITSSLRSTAQQRALFLAYYEPSSGPSDTGPWHDRRGPYDGKYWKRKASAHLTANVPGTSKHEQGLAIDTPVGGALATFLRIHPQYGWWQPVPISDPVHWEYRESHDLVRARKVTAQAHVKAVRKTLGVLGWKATKKRRVAAQQQLKAWGFYKGAIDGVYGPQTKKAWSALKAAAK